MKVPKDLLKLAEARLEAAKKGEMFWLADGGKSLIEFYTNLLDQAKAAANK